MSMYVASKVVWFYLWHTVPRFRVWRSLLPLEWQEFLPRTHAAKPIYCQDFYSGKINLYGIMAVNSRRRESACCIILVAGLSHSSVLVCVVLSTTLTSLLTHLSLIPDTYWTNLTGLVCSCVTRTWASAGHLPVDTGNKNWREVHMATHLVSGLLWSSVYGGKWWYRVLRTCWRCVKWWMEQFGVCVCGHVFCACECLHVRSSQLLKKLIMW